MKRGHCYGTRKVTRKAQAWYDKVQAERLARIERAWQEREAAKQGQTK
jgi:hypothetical protein